MIEDYGTPIPEPTDLRHWQLLVHQHGETETGEGCSWVAPYAPPAACVPLTAKATHALRAYGERLQAQRAHEEDHDAEADA
jgi:hypothetical protein